MIGKTPHNHLITAEVLEQDPAVLIQSTLTSSWNNNWSTTMSAPALPQMTSWQVTCVALITLHISWHVTAQTWVPIQSILKASMSQPWNVTVEFGGAGFKQHLETALGKALHMEPLPSSWWLYSTTLGTTILRVQGLDWLAGRSNWSGPLVSAQPD